MKCLNRVQLIGYLGREPTMHHPMTGRPFIHMRLATDSFIKVSTGRLVKQTQWHTVKIWDETLISHCINYLMKGSHILVEGELIYRKVRTRNAQSMDVVDIRVNVLIDLDR